MAMTRVVTNVGLSQPLLNDDGTPAVNALLSFQLVDQCRAPVATFDVSGALILSKEIHAKTDEHGEFTVSLWPTSRAKGVAPFYLCRVQGAYSFLGRVPEGDAPYAWLDFVAPGTATSFENYSAIAFDNGSSVDPV
jgi:hypothetical protein